METPTFSQFPRIHLQDAGSERAARHYTFGPFTLDVGRHLLTRGGSAVALPPKCFDLICLFLQSDGALLEKDHLMRALWPDTFVEEANLSNLIALLRKQLGDSPSRSRYIQTVPKVGYRFAAVVSLASRAGDGSCAPPVVRREPGIRMMVFPFRVNAGLGEQEHLGYSLPEAISSSLAELNAFTVRSMQLVMSFDPVRWDPKSVGKEAEVQYILAGSIGPGKTGISISTQLIETREGTLVWSRQWEIDAGDLASVHHAVIHYVVRRPVRAAGDTISSGSQPGMPMDSEATQMYLLANQLVTKRDAENFALARDLYVACVEKDPSFAPAWARLGAAVAGWKSSAWAPAQPTRRRKPLNARSH